MNKLPGHNFSFDPYIMIRGISRIFINGLFYGPISVSRALLTISRTLPVPAKRALLL